MQTVRRHPYAVLILLSAFLFLLGNSLVPVTDTAEANYALTSKEMVLSGDWLSPQIYGRYWYDKPIFYYWTLSASFSVFGFNEFAARFPSAVFGMLSVLFTFWFARKVYDEKTAWGAALILSTSLEFFLLAKAVITDAALFLFMSAAGALFYLGYTEDRRWYWGCWAAAALAFLTKGPIGIALPGLSCFLFLLLKKDLKEMLHVHLFSGFLLFLLLGGSWYYYMYLRHGSDFLVNFFGVHNYLRAVVPEHERQNVWYFYIMMFFAGFAPWSFGLLWSLRKKFRRFRESFREMSEPSLFLLLWAAVVILVFQGIATKYTTYTFPSLFAFAILSARLWRRSFRSVCRAAAVSAALLTAVILVAAPSVSGRFSGKDAGMALAALDTGSAPILAYDDFRTSAVFYSGKPIFRVVKKDEIDRLTPHGISWNAKNVMPFYAVEDILPGRPYIVCVTEKRKHQFLESVPGRWTELCSAGNTVIFEQKI